MALLSLDGNQLTGTIPSNLVPNWKEIAALSLTGHLKVVGKVPPLSEATQCRLADTCLVCDGVPEKCGCIWVAERCAASTIVASFLIMIVVVVMKMMF